MPSESTTATAVNSMVTKFIKSGQMRECEPCPMCGSTMLVFVNKATGQDRSQPACMACGYKVGVDGNAHSSESKIVALQKVSRRKDALAYMTHSSEVVDPAMFDNTFATFEARIPQQQKALAVAQKVARDIADGEPAHAMFTGDTGTGKSHLAMGILYEVLELTEYQRKVMFIDFRELLGKLKVGFNDPNEFKVYNQSLMTEIKRADVVVIDDLGAEGGDGQRNYQPSQYNLETVTGIFQARNNRATIVTTNLSGSDLKMMYGDRVMSRIVNHSQGHVMRFDGMRDYRFKANQKSKQEG